MTGTQPRDVCPGTVELRSSVTDGRTLISLAVQSDVLGAQDIDVTEGLPEEVEQPKGRFATCNIKGDVAVHAHSAPEFEGAALVDQRTIPEEAALESVVIQDDALAVKGTLDIVQFPTPVGVGNTTVAEAGGASSAPGGGH